jgi:hypothetical protein
MSFVLNFVLAFKVLLPFAQAQEVDSQDLNMLTGRPYFKGERVLYVDATRNLEFPSAQGGTIESSESASDPIVKWDDLAGYGGRRQKVSLSRRFNLDHPLRTFGRKVSCIENICGGFFAYYHRKSNTGDKSIPTAVKVFEVFENGYAAVKFTKDGTFWYFEPELGYSVVSVERMSDLRRLTHSEEKLMRGQETFELVDQKRETQKQR